MIDPNNSVKFRMNINQQHLMNNRIVSYSESEDERYEHSPPSHTQLLDKRKTMGLYYEKKFTK